MSDTNIKNRMDTLRKSFRLPWKTGKRYNVLEGKENTYFNTPKPSHRRQSSEGQIQNIQQNNKESRFKRNTSLTRSVRDAVGTIKQKFRSSTRQRKRLHDDKPTTPLRKTKKTTQSAGKTSNQMAYRDVKMYSPFTIETPRKHKGIRTVTQSRACRQEQFETPTRLKKEVEALTSNMKALAALTPNTLQDRASRRKSPITNGSLKTRTTRTSMTARKQIHTFVY
ncbi:unnamed protein product [Mytilus coruscus]|uniref:Uncharacterized protein n=1 Tax=Mytilus coruscus TaxID=42192 RepID=A0A6J8BFU6_MYTCO|nr:unnamed protein product [Mytilus coruscus]